MYFRVIDHYPDFQEDEPPELNECLICLESITHDNLRPIDLKTQQIYLKNCDCGGLVHMSCLCEWYDISNTCPICRLYMKKSQSMTYIFSFNFDNFCGTSIFVLSRVSFVVWFIFAISFSCHIYQCYFILKHRNYNDECQRITE